ncbi:MAG TPA: PAS domain-containing protein [Chitinophagaceae bacterium]|nr:PAS domain-containing protein [Chitinophagaceae bacterium]
MEPLPSLLHVFELITDAFVALDTNWRYTYMNRRAGEIFNRDPASMIGRHIWEEFPEGIGQPFYHAYHRAMESQQAIHLEEYYPPYDRWFENHIYPFPQGLYIFFRDITEKKKDEERIVKSNRLYNFLSQVNQLIVRIPDQGTLFREICQIAVSVGKFRMAWIGLLEETSHRVVPVTFAGEEEDYLSRIVPITTDPVSTGLGPTGTAIREGNYIVCNDVEADPRMAPWKDAALGRGYLSSIALPIRKAGKVMGAFTLYASTKHFFDGAEIQLLREAVEDLSFAMEVFDRETFRKQAELALAASEKRYHTLTEISPVGIFYTDETGYTTYVNRRWCQITGMQPDQALGYGWLSAVHEEDRDALLQGWRDATRLKRTSISEYRFLRPNGDLVWVIGQAIPERNEQNEILGYVGTTTDITDLKEAEEEIRQMNRELQKLSGYLLRVRDVERKRIGQEIHDELGQQLTAIKMDIAWLNKKLPAQETAMRAKIQNTLDLLDSSNRSIRRILAELRPMALDDQDLAEAVTWLGNQFSQNTGIQVDFQQQGTPFELSEQLSNCIFRVYQEALTNITRHAAASQVRTVLSFGELFLGFSVTDDGKGFDREILRSKSSFGILGMRERVRSLGGQFEIDSVPGSGTRITVRVPRNAQGIPDEEFTDI